MATENIAVVVETRPCMMCGNTSTLHYTAKEAEGFRRWQNGELIQNAMPWLSADEREMLMTGTHPDCWDEMF